MKKSPILHSGLLLTTSMWYSRKSIALISIGLTWWNDIECGEQQAAPWKNQKSKITSLSFVNEFQCNIGE